MQDTEREFDVILWGATGFTGQLVAAYLAKQYGFTPETQDSGEPVLRWAIAGRNSAKLEAVAKSIEANQDGSNAVVQIIADSDDAESIEALVKRAKVICTTVGPYALYGEGLVAACASAGTSYCDLTGEVQFMAEMIEKYQFVAEESGAKIVHCCGFDSIPSDLGVHYLQTKMREQYDETASEIHFGVRKMSGGASGGTIASMMTMMEQINARPELKDLIADPYALNPANMPRGDDENDAMGPEFDRLFKTWTAPFVMAGVNTRVVRRSNALQDYAYGRDFRYSEVMLMGTGPMAYLKSGITAGLTGLMMLVAFTKPGRSLLNKFVPQPGEGPSPEAIEKGFFDIELIGVKRGAENQAEAKQIAIRVTGDKDPGYGATCKMLAESAVCLALDPLTEGGGLMTPASAMGDQLIARLKKNAGMGFEQI